MAHSAENNQVFRYVGGVNFSTHCDDCEQKATRVYETGSGIIYLCRECGDDMENSYEMEQKAIKKGV